MYHQIHLSNSIWNPCPYSIIDKRTLVFTISWYQLSVKNNWNTNNKLHFGCWIFEQQCSEKKFNVPVASVIYTIILPLIEIFKFDWLRQILYAAILCFLTNLIFLIYPLYVTYRPHYYFSQTFPCDFSRNFTLWRHKL